MKVAAIFFVLAIILQVSSISMRNHEGRYAWYTYDESKTGNQCSNFNSDLCDGQRTCPSSGWCMGTARPPKNDKYYYDEKITGGKCPTSQSDPNWKNKDYYCDGWRWCSGDGICWGTAR